MWAERTVKARTRHKCFHCAGAIKPGNNYKRVAGVYQGDFWYIEAHIECMELAIEYQDLAGDEEFTHLYEELCQTRMYNVDDGMRRLMQRYNNFAKLNGGITIDEDPVPI